MDLAEPVPRTATPARRTDVWMLLFLLFLVITFLCLHSLRDDPAGAPAPVHLVEYAAVIA